MTIIAGAPDVVNQIDQLVGSALHVICRANSTVGTWPAPLTTQNLVEWFGATSSAFQRAEPMLRAVGAHRQLRYADIALGTPDLLVSSRRAEIIEQRERLLAE